MNRFFRFHKNVAAGEIGNTHSVQHFWLGGQSCRKFTLEYKDRKGLVINRNDTLRQSESSSRFIAA